jgi:hypothetical protein
LWANPWSRTGRRSHDHIDPEEVVRLPWWRFGGALLELVHDEHHDYSDPHAKERGEHALPLGAQVGRVGQIDRDQDASSDRSRPKA